MQINVRLILHRLTPPCKILMVLNYALCIILLQRLRSGKDRSQNGIGNGVDRFFALRLALFNELKHYEPGVCR